LRQTIGYGVLTEAGLRSPDRISKGQFIDTYLGEVIADAEAVRREKAATKGKDSYLFSLDKFQGIEGEPGYIPTEELYVVDGEFMGGPTRFMNHSCDPNCRQFAVIMTRGDMKIYELAFFALEDIPPGTELTFDYLDKDHDSDDDKDRVTDDNVKSLERQKDKLATKCLCQSSNCRKYLWL
jgi:histone-lysine N-methyltransferase SUV39H